MRGNWRSGGDGERWRRGSGELAQRRLNAVARGRFQKSRGRIPRAETRRSGVGGGPFGSSIPITDRDRDMARMLAGSRREIRRRPGIGYPALACQLPPRFTRDVAEHPVIIHARGDPPTIPLDDSGSARGRSGRRAVPIGEINPSEVSGRGEIPGEHDQTSSSAPTGRMLKDADFRLDPPDA